MKLQQRTASGVKSQRRITRRVILALLRLIPVLIVAILTSFFIWLWLTYGLSNAEIQYYLSTLTDFFHAYPRIAFVLGIFLWCLIFVFALASIFVLLLPTEGVWIMNHFHRLTNRQALEEEIAREKAALFINAEKLARVLKSKVIGQDAVCEDIAAQIRRRLALQQRGKPVGVFLLAGPPGTGKTYLAKCLANELQRKLVHLDMTLFSVAGHGASQLFGAAKGYIGSESYGKLTCALYETPDAVILLDEFEKAHPEVHKNFLTAWNDGFITESSDGQEISTTKAIFVLTTNAATDALLALSSTYADQPDELRRTSINALKESGFAPEVLNRIDRVLVFKALSGLDIARVTALEIEVMIESYGLSISTGGIDPQLLLDMMRRQKKLGSGASSRDLVRAVEESIADTLIEAKQKGYTTVSLISKNGIVQAKAS